MFQRVEREGSHYCFTALRDVILATLKAKLPQEHEMCDGTLHGSAVVSNQNETLCTRIVRALPFIQFAVWWLVIFGRHHKNKPIELLTFGFI
jgi:hypothetical protein